MASCAFAAMNATFDLSPLHKAGGAYHVEDKFDATRNYTYSVNVCGSVDPRELAAACDDRGAGAAFQAAQWYESCYRLGALGGNFSLLDGADPARGVRLTYGGGDSCGWTGDRQFTFDLVCKDKFNIPDRFEEYVEELVSTPCHYSLELETIWGCPRECEIGLSSSGELRLCSGNGVCAFDEHRGAPGCFCFGDYDGSDCSTISAVKARCDDDEANSGVVAGLVAIAILCALILALVALGVRETRKNRFTYDLLLEKAAAPPAPSSSKGGPVGEIELC